MEIGRLTGATGTASLRGEPRRPAEERPAPAVPDPQPAVRLDLGQGGALEAPKTPNRPAPDSLDTRYTRDPESKALLFQVVDSRTGDVVVQLPDKALMGRRAYARDQQAQADAQNDVRRLETSA